MLRRLVARAMLILGALVILIVSNEQASSQVFDIPRKPIEFRSPVRDKNFYLLTLLASTNHVAAKLGDDPELSSLEERKVASTAHCPVDPIGCADRLSFSPEDVALVSRRLLYHLRTEPRFRTSVVRSMRESGLFELYSSSDDFDLVLNAWADAARGINRIIGVYGRNEKPRYSQIDSPSFDLKSAEGVKRLGGFTTKVATEAMKGSKLDDRLWFQPSLKFALFLLALNDREQAGNYEPLDKGENAAALARIHRVNWSHYPYSVIVVPGLGPETAGVALAPGAEKRIELAANNYRKGLAPFILVSGGNVHPTQTPFCEAIEMKKVLVHNLRIPAEAIVVETQARHTTTNIRNASRLLYRYGFPLNVPALVTSDESQTRSIVSPQFVARNMKELGYLPFQALKPVSPTDTAFNFEIKTLQADASDPLDP